MHKPRFRVIYLLAALFFEACSGNGNGGKNNGLSGKDSLKEVVVSVDETYQPIFRQEADAFHHHFPKIKIQATYKPENEALRDLVEKKCLIAIVSRPATSAEKKKLKHDGGIVIHETLMGYDALALIVHKDNPVKQLSVENFKKMLRGEINNWKELGGEDKEIVMVFDNPGSGTVRHIKDSLMSGADLPANVFAAKTNPEVIRYVGETPQAVGFIGLAWVSDQDNPEVQQFLSAVDKVALKAEGLPDKPENYFLPFQTEIKLGQYPLARGIYCLNRESNRGPGTDFVYFFAGDAGQRILLKAGLLPEFMPPRQIVFKQEK